MLAWGSVIASDETAVFASLSRMIWYSGSAQQIFIAMLVLFVPMLISFFLAHNVIGLPKIMPSDGTAMTKENIWHGIMSFGGMLMIFLTYCLYTAFIVRMDKEGAGLLSGFLVFSLITGAFAVLNVFDERSYVIASAVSELYVLTMMNLVGYMTYYLAYRKRKAE